MSDVVVITTDDLDPAVRLRARFAAAGYGVELLTSGETLADVAGTPVLVVLTGGIHDPKATQLIAEASRIGRLPVIGLLEPTDKGGAELCRSIGLSECLTKPIDVEEAALIGKRAIERERLRQITGIVGSTDVMEEVL